MDNVIYRSSNRSPRQLSWGGEFSRLGLVTFFLSVLLGDMGNCFAEFHVNEGFQQFQAGKHLRIVTDLPVDDSIRELGQVFDSAMDQWCDFFQVPRSSVKDWTVTMYLMLDRNRFDEAGLLPEEGVLFPHGWQSDQRIWLMEQPSSFYRRHLMLHEGTHWFMLQIHGKYHVPWLAEGLAEWFGTHRWKDGNLETRIIPQDRQEAPYWGRIALIQRQLQLGEAPGIEEIWRYDSTAHQRLEAYSWSWAMVVFLEAHPSTSGTIQALLREPIMDIATAYRWLRERFGQKLPLLRTDWRAFVSDLDYGYCSKPGILELSPKSMPLDDAVSLQLRADRGWQASGVTVEAGQEIDVRSTGEYIIGNYPRPWRCQPDGVTLEYYRGQPLGRVMMVIAAAQPKETLKVRPIEPISVGLGKRVTADLDGELFFRINQPNGSLGDNQGFFEIEILPADAR